MISNIWTPEERLKVVAKISKQMNALPEVQRSEKLLDIQERLMFLAVGSSSILEINREAIINGHFKELK